MKTRVSIAFGKYYAVDYFTTGWNYYNVYETEEEAIKAAEDLSKKEVPKSTYFENGKEL